MKNLFYLLIVAQIFSGTICAQNDTLSYGGKFEKIYDHQGNVYDLSDLLVDPALPSTMGGGNQIPCVTNGYFNVVFDAGSGFDVATNPLHLQRRGVLCQVLGSVSV